MTIPAGYYPDPDPSAAPGSLRWWDGAAWTATVQPPPPAAPPPPPPYAAAPVMPNPYAPVAPYANPYAAAHPYGTRLPSLALVSPRTDLAVEQSIASWARIGVPVFAICQICALLLNLHSLEQLHQAFVDLNDGYSYSYQYTPSAVVDLLGLLGWGSLVPFLIWQYRAARLARNARLPASVGPGLGVGSWFIPILNLWFPYQALRDLTAPTSSARGIVRLLWAGFITALVLTIVSYFIALFGGSHVAAFVAGIVAGIGFAVFGVQAALLVGAVGDEHAQLIEQITSGQ